MQNELGGVEKFCHCPFALMQKNEKIKSGNPQLKMINLF